MTTEMVLQELTTRVQSLETKVDLLSAKLQLPPLQSEENLFEYIVFADEQEVWRGQELYENFPELLRKYPRAQFSILWQPNQPFLWV